MTVVIAGDRSGVGKTTITLALLAYLKQRGLDVRSFKVGPDYIDPMFHRYVTGLPCRNLDPMLTSEAYVQECFARHIADADLAIVEGVMGLFDGIQFASDLAANYFASTAHIALLLNLPVLLVIDCSKLSGSVAAIANGFLSFDPRIKFAGLVLNRVGSDRHQELLLNALKPLNLSVLGIVRRHHHITIPDRHLGLIPTDEIPQLNHLIQDLANLANTCFDWSQLLPLLKTKSEGSEPHLGMHIPPDFIIAPLPDIVKGVAPPKSKISIAIARDAAFNFYYQDNLDLLQKFGAEIVFFSPLTDTSLPAGVQGLYLGGGFPEVFARQLSENSQMREAIKTAIISGMPTYAECGGLMYLSAAIVDFEGNSWKMVGVLPTTAVMGKALKLGYRQAVAIKNSPLLAADSTVCGHEFHRSELTVEPEFPLYKIWNGDRDKIEISARVEGWKFYQVHASYIHLHWGNQVEIPQRFLRSCQNFSGQNEGDRL